MAPLLWGLTSSTVIEILGQHSSQKVNCYQDNLAQLPLFASQQCHNNGIRLNRLTCSLISEDSLVPNQALYGCLELITPELMRTVAKLPRHSSSMPLPSTMAKARAIAKPD